MAPRPMRRVDDARDEDLGGYEALRRRARGAGSAALDVLDAGAEITWSETSGRRSRRGDSLDAEYWDGSAFTTAAPEPVRRSRAARELGAIGGRSRAGQQPRRRRIVDAQADWNEPVADARPDDAWWHSAHRGSLEPDSPEPIDPDQLDSGRAEDPDWELLDTGRAEDPDRDLLDTGWEEQADDRPPASSSEEPSDRGGARRRSATRAGAYRAGAAARPAAARPVGISLGVGAQAASESWNETDLSPGVAVMAMDSAAGFSSLSAGSPRRTVVITGRGAERGRVSRRRPDAGLAPHERFGFQPDRLAFWAFLLGLALLLGAAATSHAATLAATHLR
jgi:hypothetical protein